MIIRIIFWTSIIIAGFLAISWVNLRNDVFEIFSSDLSPKPIPNDLVSNEITEVSKKFIFFVDFPVNYSDFPVKNEITKMLELKLINYEESSGKYSMGIALLSDLLRMEAAENPLMTQLYFYSGLLPRDCTKESKVEWFSCYFSTTAFNSGLAKLDENRQKEIQKIINEMEYE